MTPQYLSSFSPIGLISIFLLLLLPYAYSVSFNFSEFQPNTPNILYRGDAFSSGGVLQLTKNQRDGLLTQSVGRAFFSEPVQLWDSRSNRLTDFETHFSFIIRAVDLSMFGDGLSFYLAPFPSDVPANSTGGFLGLFSEQSAFNSNANQVVAVEFDSLMNWWDPSANHVGINVNSIVSVANVTWNSSIKDGREANAWVSYNSSTKLLSAFLTYAENPVNSGNSTLSHEIDLREVLPERVCVGFSASTGEWIEIHNILSWEFQSSLEITNEKGKNIGLVTGIVVGACFFCCVLGVVGFVWRKKRNAQTIEEIIYDQSMDDEFEKGKGPKRFSYNELVINVLNFEAPLPNLPSKLPTPIYYAPPMQLCKFFYESSDGLPNSHRDRSQCSCSSCSTYNSSKLDISSSSTSPSKSLMGAYNVGR
ncbi:Lectin-related protein [Thalictrum thalictroides]|uniref:Lectin-related protein n=1 Tax=Thalictrum thalictroides TaxID=46969 RepID=A0A7J6X8S9_THATH|nr:Lectin-related protein [Thalictrum thalictroides]